MTKKNKTVFVCQECGYESPKWLGQCICGAWNSFAEEKLPSIDVDDARRRSGAAHGGKPSTATPLRDILVLIYNISFCNRRSWRFARVNRA